MSIRHMPEIDFERVGPAVGTKMPGLRLRDQSGRLIDLHGYIAGRKALVVFYRSAKW